MKLNQLEEKIEQVDYLSSQIQNVNSSIQGISGQVQLKLNEFLQEQMWVTKKDYEIKKVDVENNSIEVSLNWNVRELNEDEDMVLLYRDKENKDWQEMNVDKDDALTFQLTHTFPLDGNYETQILARSPEGTRSEPLLTLNFKEQLDQRIMVDGFMHPLDEKEASMNIHIYNQLQSDFLVSYNSSDFKVTKASALIYVKNEVINQVDLLEESQNINEDPYSENLVYNSILNLEELGASDISDIKVEVVIVDGLGMEYKNHVRVMP